MIKDFKDVSDIPPLIGLGQRVQLVPDCISVSCQNNTAV